MSVHKVASFIPYVLQFKSVTTLFRVVPGQPSHLDQTLLPVPSYNSGIVSSALPNLDIGALPLARVELHLPMAMKVTL